VRFDTDASGDFALAERIIVAGGGGGAGGFGGGAGGYGGGSEGGPGAAGVNGGEPGGGGGGGGTSTEGGAGGDGQTARGDEDGDDGGIGTGGSGGSDPTCPPSTGFNDVGGGGGGGGYYGGGGGGGGFSGGGGGGGSGFGPSGVVFSDQGVRSGDGLVTITYTPPDSTAPTTTIALTPTSPNGLNGWYTTAVHTTISATDGSGSGVAETRCVLDPASAPASFDDLPSTPCPYLGSGSDVSTDGQHTLYAASVDARGNKETPVVSQQFKIDTMEPSASCSVTPSMLRPANNHKLVPVRAEVTVSDEDGSGPNGLRLVSVISNQPDSGLASDDVPNDIQGWTDSPDGTSGLLRAERYGDPRVYTLTYEGEDVAGNATECVATVTVPKGR
jgi:hypothetical protein